MRTFLAELSRRRVYATVSIYVIASWLLMQVADVLFPGWGIAEESIRYVLYTAVACFPIACLVGWRYDITRQGIRKTPSRQQEMQGETGTRLGGGDRLFLLAMLVAVVAIVGIFARQALQHREWAGEPLLANSLAVMPLASLSDDGENAYFADGLTGELINMLGQISGFRVTPRASTDYFRGRNPDLGEVASKLRVAHVLTGSVQRAADRVRVSLSLTDTASGYNLWSENFDRELKDIFAIQSEIARAVAATLQVELLGADEQRLENPPTTSTEAHDLVLLAAQQQDLRKTRELLERAMDLDPEYLEAHYRRALVEYLSWGRSQAGWIGAEESIALTGETLALAERLDPDSPETSYWYNWLKGLKMRRQVHMGFEMNAAYEREMESAFLRAIELNPSESTPYVSLAFYYRNVGRLVDAEKMMLRALELDRLYKTAMLQLARIYGMQGRDDDALELLTRVTDLFETDYDQVAHLHADLGRYDQAVEWFMKSHDLEAQSLGRGQIFVSLAGIYVALGDRERAGVIMGKYLGDWDQALQAARAGRFEEAYKIAAERIESSGATQWWMLNEPAEYAIRAGRHEDAIRLYEIAFPNLRDPLRPDVSNANLPDVLLFAWALQQSGDQARAGVLYGRLLDELEGRRRVGHKGYGAMDSCVYAALGEHQQAVNAMQAAYDEGWRGLYYNAIGQPCIMYQGMAENAEFNSLMASIKADLEDQLQGVRDMGY